MRSRKAKRNEESEVDITPMIDIVFIMLIFFIVTASFAKESGVEVDRPDKNNKAQNSNKVSILVAIDENGQIWVGGRPVDVRATRANIETLRAENPEAGVVIQASGASRNGLLVQVVDAARLAGVNEVSLVQKK